MKIRVISLLLAVVLAVMLIPAPASAAAPDAAEIQQQIRTAYQKSLRACGRTSFNGYCGSLVSWQMYCLGIDKKVYACDGKDQFDQYRKMDRTTGGYRVTSYPASKYTLREALNAITQNGTIDAYNMVVGFEKTNTQAGSIYGHALLVHAILDGVVYFVECYNSSVGGRYWAEGQAISCTIEQFCDYYNRWTVFDGIAYFGLRTYADMCTEESSAMHAIVTEDTYIYEEPGDPGVYDPQAECEVIAGQWLTVNGLLTTPHGKYWYRVEYGDTVGYVEAEKLTMSAISTGDVTLTNLRAPTSLYKGNGFTVKGTVTSESGMLQNVRVKVVDTTGFVLYRADITGQNESVSLNNRTINNALTFRKMDAGIYELVVEATVKIHVLEDGAVQTRTGTLELNRSRFRVVTDWSKYPTVTFDGNGGDALLDQTVAVRNQALGTLPTATRSGYAFAGWSLDKAGTELVTEETVITGNTALYAQWKNGHAGVEGWQQTEDGDWHYCDGENPVEGWITFDDLQFYQHADGTLAKGWVWIDGGIRYFNEAGALITELQGEDGRTYYLEGEGSGVLGWNTQLAGDSQQITEENIRQDLQKADSLSAAGRAMSKLSTSVCWMAVQSMTQALSDSVLSALEEN